MSAQRERIQRSLWTDVELRRAVMRVAEEVNEKGRAMRVRFPLLIESRRVSQVSLVLEDRGTEGDELDWMYFGSPGPGCHPEDLMEDAKDWLSEYDECLFHGNSPTMIFSGVN